VIGSSPALRLAFASLIALGIGVMAPGCQNWFRGDIGPPPLLLPGDGANGNLDVSGDGPPVNVQDAPGVGDACGDGIDTCRQGLVCVNGLCRAVGTSSLGNTCLLSDECAGGLVCGLGGRCDDEGAGAPGDLCVRPEECKKGFVCATTGFYGTCVATGTGDLGNACVTVADCFGGLYCAPAGACETASPFYGYQGWKGAICDPTPGVGNYCDEQAPCEGELTCETSQCVDNRPPRVHFELAPRSDGDFFRLPFPSDTRVSAGGTIDLTGFPTPGSGLVGRDAVAALVTEASSSQTDWSTTPTVLFRFSHTMDKNSFTGKDTEEQPATVRYVNIEPESVGYGTGPSLTWYLTSNFGRYICRRWAAIRTAPETPLRWGEQYAVLFTRGLAAASGEEAVADDDLVKMLSDDTPSGPAAVAAWETHANLRAYLDSEGIARENVVGAAVFTAGSPAVPVGGVREAVAALPIPEPSEATLCQDGAVSPCDDGATGTAHVRGCLGTTPGLSEIHFRLELPRVQQGQPPYIDPGSGGGVATKEDGTVELSTTDSVCVSMAVPIGQAMPPGGWPLVVVVPDIGDTFRSAVENFGELVTGLEHEGVAAGAILVSWEGPLHGERADSEHALLARVRNFANPAAARGNVLQGVADLTEIVRTMGALSWEAEASPTGEALDIDPTHIAVLGHGHGATLATLGAAQEPAIGLVVLSGAGAFVAETWLERTDPVEAAVGLALAFSEMDDNGPMAITRHHPALVRFSSFMSAVDPVNHAQLLAKSPLDGAPRRHVLNVLGVPNTNVSDGAARLFARRLGAPIVGTAIDEISGLGLLETPASGTLGKEPNLVTAATIQAGPENGSSAHRALFEDAGVRAQAASFLASWLTTGVPVVPPRL
jgi:hypothetical protein